MINCGFFVLSNLLKRVCVYFTGDHGDNADSTVQHNDQTHPEPAQQTEDC